MRKYTPQGLFLPSFHLERSQFVKSQNNIRRRGKMGKGLSDPKYLLFAFHTNSIILRQPSTKAKLQTNYEKHQQSLYQHEYAGYIDPT